MRSHMDITIDGLCCTSDTDHHDHRHHDDDTAETGIEVLWAKIQMPRLLNLLGQIVGNNMDRENDEKNTNPPTQTST